MDDIRSGTPYIIASLEQGFLKRMLDPCNNSLRVYIDVVFSHSLSLRLRRLRILVFSKWKSTHPLSYSVTRPRHQELGPTCNLSGTLQI